MPNVDTDSRLIDLLETVKQDPEGGKNILKHEQKSRPGFDDLVPDVFRFPKDLLSKKSIFTSQSKADGKHREDGGRRIEFELDSLPVEFETIVSKLDKSANKLIQIKRAKQSEINQSDKAIARVVKHKDNPLSQTVFIQNFSEVHKAVGVRNASDNLQNTNKLPENTSEEKRSPEFLFTDDKIINERKPQIKTVIIKNSKTEFAKFGVKNVPREFLNHLPEQRRPTKSVDERQKHKFLYSVHKDISKDVNKAFQIQKKKINAFSARDNDKNADVENTLLGNSSQSLIHFTNENNIAPPLYFSGPHSSQIEVFSRRKEKLDAMNTENYIPTHNLDNSDTLNLKTNLFAGDNEIIDSFDAETDMVKTSPSLNIISVSEVRKSLVKATVRPEMFLRKPDIEQFQGTTTSSQAHEPWKKMKYSQENENNIFQKYGKVSNQIVTDRPTSSFSGNGQFKAPSTLVYGFQPMTTPVIPYTTISHRINQGRLSYPTTLGFGFGPTTPQPEVYLRSSNKQHTRQSDSMIDRINTFLHPIISLMRG